MKNRFFMRLLLPALALLLLVACGAPTSQPAQPADEEETTAVQDNQDTAPSLAANVFEADTPAKVDTSNTAVPVTSVVTTNDEADTATTETYYQDIPTGFTEDGRPYLGNLDAPVIIEEYSDYQCPYCARFTLETKPTLKTEALINGEAVLIFYDFPLEFHPQGIPAANAARCAGEQGAIQYWQMHEALFADVQAWGNANATAAFNQLASDLGLDTDSFATCIDENRYEADINADIAHGRERGVTGTPSFFINDQMMFGAQPAPAFLQAIAAVNSGETIAQPPQADSPPAAQEIPPFQMPTQVTLSPATTPAKGNDDAPITIVEFSDYQCPFCQRHVGQTMPTLLAELVETGRVRYEFKDFPLDEIHPDARSAAAAARCAEEQNSYWEMHNVLFSNQQSWSGLGDGATAVYSDLANGLGLDGDQIADCIASGRYDEAIQADYEEGLTHGVTGTPAFFIDGYFISGAQPYDLFEIVVNAIETDTIEALFREAYDAQVEAYLAQQQAQQAPPPPPTDIEVPIDQSNPSLGDPNAPITLIEYTDFQCPYCGRHFAQTFPLIKENFIDTGLVRYVFKDFPLNFHPQAQKAAEAARCAHEQDAFLDMHQTLFENQQGWSGQSNATEQFIGYANNLQLDVEAFTSCLNSDRYAEAVQADLAEGSGIGITGTPSFVVNGTLLVGAVPYPTFEQAFQSFLTE